MEQIRLFYLSDCPYCHDAKRALGELIASKSVYAGIPIEWVDERRHPEIVERFDYKYVPSIFCGTKKLFEAYPGQSYADIKAQIRAALDEILKLAL